MKKKKSRILHQIYTNCIFPDGNSELNIPRKTLFKMMKSVFFDLIDVFDVNLPKGTKSNQNRKEMNTVSGINNISTERGTIDEMITEISLSEIHSFKNHPFKVVDDERMMDTAESIRA